MVRKKRFEFDGLEHFRCDVNCSECWPGFPILHEGCGGLIHADFGDEKANGDYFINTKCDKCGLRNWDLNLD